MIKTNINQIKAGAIISYFTLAVSIITGLLYTPWMVRQIGQANYGLYTLATSFINIFMVDFGLGAAVSRFVSKYRAENNQKAINSIIGVVTKLYLLVDAVIVIVLVVIYFFLDAIYVKLTPHELEQFKILYIMVSGFDIIYLTATPLSGILNAYEKFIQLKISGLFLKLSTVAFVVITLFITNNVIIVVAAHIASGLLEILLKFVFVKTSAPIKLDFSSRDKNFYKTLFGFTLWTTITNTMSNFMHGFAPSVLGMTSSSVEIAIYSPAVVLNGYFNAIATAVNGMFLPRISRYIADKKEHEILNLMVKVGKYQITVLGLAFIGFLCVGQDFMILWMGPEYAKTYYCVLMLIVPTLISCSQQIANTTVIAKNLVKYQAICNVITGFVGLVVSYIASIPWGAIGVCLGVAVTTFANTIYMNIVYYKKAGINVFEFYKKTYLKAIPCYALAAVLSFVLVSFIQHGGWLGLIIKAAVIVAVYGVIFAFLYFSKAEKYAVLKRLKIIK